MAPFPPLTDTSGHTEAFCTGTPNGTKTVGHSGAQPSFKIFCYQSVCMLSSRLTTSMLDKNGRPGLASHQLCPRVELVPVPPSDVEIRHPNIPAVQTLIAYSISYMWLTACYAQGAVVRLKYDTVVSHLPVASHSLHSLRILSFDVRLSACDTYPFRIVICDYRVLFTCTCVLHH